MWYLMEGQCYYGANSQGQVLRDGSTQRQPICEYIAHYDEHGQGFDVTFALAFESKALFAFPLAVEGIEREKGRGGEVRGRGGREGGVVGGREGGREGGIQHP